MDQTIHKGWIVDSILHAEGLLKTLRCLEFAAH